MRTREVQPKGRNSVQLVTALLILTWQNWSVKYKEIQKEEKNIDRKIKE